nr:hypothetical protein Iba_chr09aCG12760 [Ipomoea batatas]GMD32789.1 hypothetical protein Iba_chr09bCG11550 [Ipomoea batatas]
MYGEDEKNPGFVYTESTTIVLRTSISVFVVHSAQCPTPVLSSDDTGVLVSQTCLEANVMSMGATSDCVVFPEHANTASMGATSECVGRCLHYIKFVS